MMDCILFRQFEQKYGGDGSVSELIEQICELGVTGRFDYSVQFDLRTYVYPTIMDLLGKVRYNQAWFNFKIHYNSKTKTAQVLRWSMVIVDPIPVTDRYKAKRVKTVGEVEKRVAQISALKHGGVTFIPFDADDVWISTLVDLMQPKTESKPEPVVDHQANPGLSQERFFEYQLGYQPPF